MGRPWGIAHETDRDGLARWKALVAAGHVDHLVIRIGARDGVALTRRGDEVVVADVPHFDRIAAEIDLLVTDDMTWDDVGRILDGAMVLLPMRMAPRWLPAAIDGFDPQMTFSGLTALAEERGRSALEIQLRTAAELALVHHLAIQVSP